MSALLKVAMQDCLASKQLNRQIVFAGLAGVAVCSLPVMGAGTAGILRNL
jgi:hypothetical protein